MEHYFILKRTIRILVMIACEYQKLEIYNKFYIITGRF